ncbi:MAG: type II toxin-antitoxin system RelE/ParE family toxin [bacterium]|nr:type II toxin-antitoxin system RelE/ParE family toxin [bacterium]MDE0669540.1 type II toxin-antitoxin system RelE/ParE family toxin [bacterium]
MIRGFKDRRTERFYRGQPEPRFSAIAAQASRRLTLLDSAEPLRDLAELRSNRLESLSGDRAGSHSIRINRQWRVCFYWGTDGLYDVEIVDYHR